MEIFILRLNEDLELCWIPVLSEYFLKNVLTAGKNTRMFLGAFFANKNSKVYNKILGLVLTAINAIIVKVIFTNMLE